MGLPKTCIIGAGVSGIAAMRALQKAELPYTCYEVGSKVGGLWRYDNDNGMSHIYQTLHTNTSSERTCFSDFPMPEDYPDFPSHEQVFAYLTAYVDQFGLDEHIQFKHRVEHVSHRSDGTFAINVLKPDGSHQLERFDAVIVANGHHWKPNIPELPSGFNGDVIHSSEYRKSIDHFDRRVLVVGGGNSACDIASDLSGVAKSVAMSMRTPVHIVPKYVMGRPIDLWTSATTSRLPMIIRRSLFEFLLYLGRGRQSSYGVPRPSYPLDAAHPTISDDILGLVGHGKVTIHPAIESIQRERIQFVDDSSGDFDTIILATGFEVAFPFLDAELIHVNENAVELYHHVVHPSVKQLFFVGLVQPLGAIPPLAETQSDWIADLINGRVALPGSDEMWQEIREERKRIRDQYYDSPRHAMDVDFFEYVRKIQTEQSRK